LTPSGFPVGWQRRPKAPKNRQNFQLDGMASVWQHGTTMSGTEKDSASHPRSAEDTQARKKQIAIRLWAELQERVILLQSNE
jgi:hypothetical protein